MCSLVKSNQVYRNIYNERKDTAKDNLVSHTYKSYNSISSQHSEHDLQRWRNNTPIHNPLSIYR